MALEGKSGRATRADKINTHHSEGTQGSIFKILKPGKKELGKNAKSA